MNIFKMGIILSIGIITTVTACIASNLGLEHHSHFMVIGFIGGIISGVMIMKWHSK